VYWHILLCSEPAEIGIRMALGAETAQVRLLIMKEVGSMVLLGVAVGLPLSMDWRASVNRCSLACALAIPWFTRSAWH